MKKFSFIETIIIINLVMAVLTGVLWLSMRSAREMRRQEIIEQCGVSDLIQEENIGGKNIKIYRCPKMEILERK